MNFDHNFKPNRDNLPAAIIAMMDRVFYSRRSQGMNVQFIREDGQLDEWSFDGELRARIFADNLESNGVEFAISN